MRHQEPAELDVSVYFPAIAGAKHLATRALLVAAQPQVLVRCQEYDLAFPQLQTPPLLAWPNATKAALLSCYNISTMPLSAMKDAILQALCQQAQVHLERCPYCMLNDPRTWDHYLPKDDYPEYSVYHRNLLYVCFGCNQRKWDHHDANALLYCHPYFSVPEAASILHCAVDINNGSLTVHYYGAGPEGFEVAGEVAQRHLERLCLDARFQAEAASLVSNLIGELRHHFPEGVQLDALRAVLRRRYAEAQARLGRNAWDARLWHALAASGEFAQYANAQIAAANVPSEEGFATPAPPPI